MKNLLKNKKVVIGSIAVAVIALIIGIVWSLKQEKPVNLTRNVEENIVNLSTESISPRQIRIDSNSKTVLGPISPLYVYASNNKEFIAFEYQDKDVTSLVTITPEIRGTWVSKGGDNLIFTPQKDWLPGQKYTVSLNKELISPEVKLKDNTLQFTTDNNNIYLKNLSLNKDVTKSKKFDILATLLADYPLDEKKFVDGVNLTLNGKKIQPQITFDQFKRYAFIKYEDVKITDKEQKASLEIKYPKADKYPLNIPSESKYFKVNNISTIVEEENNTPRQLIVIEFTDEVAPKQIAGKVEAYLVKRNTRVTEKVLNAAKKLELKQMPSEDESKVHSFEFDFNDENYDYNVYVKVNPIIVSQSGFKITQEQNSTLRVPQYPKKITFMGDGSIIPLNGSKTVNIVSLGVNKMNLTVARIMSGQINHLISQTYSNMKNAEFRESYIFNEDNISDKFTETVSINANYKTPNYYAADLAKYMTQDNKGLFVVSAQSEKDYSVKARRLILVSDIGIIYKVQDDNTAKLYAFSVDTEKPLAGVKVEVLALNGTIIKTLSTDKDGIANIPDLSDYNYEKKPVAFLVKKDKDFNYIPYDSYDRKVSYSRFDVDGDNGRRDLEVFGWTDRGLYLPGEKVNYALIAKNKNWSTTSGLPLKVTISDPRGSEISKENVSLTKDGLLEFSYQLKEAATMGLYQIDIYSYNGRYYDYLNNINFKVEEFEEDKLKVSSVIENEKPKGWFLTKEPLKFAVTVENLYGSPAQGNEVKATAKVMPKTFDFKDFGEYKFADNLSADTLELTPETISLTPQKTDALGKTTFEVDVNKYAKGTYMMRFTAEAFGQESSKSVLEYNSALISPLEYIVGYKTSNNLSFLNKDEKADINFIAINNNLDKIDLKGLTLILKEQKYISVLTKQYDNYYRYQSTLQEKEISRKDFAVGKKGTEYTLPTDKPGKYAIVLYDKNGESVSKIEYFVAGQSNTTFNLEKDAELVMYLNKKTFKPGEEITIDLITPYEGIGLITLEKDKVYASKWFTTKTNSTIQKIQVPNDLEGGAYINISFVRGRQSSQIYVSPYSYAVSYIKVEPENRILNIDLNTPQLVQPGQDLKIEYKTSAPAKIILFGSSEGILQVAKYKTPDPLNYFFRKKGLGVETYQILDLLLPDFEVVRRNLSTGGDTAAALDAFFANEFKRKRLAPVTFWSTVLQANNTAKTFTYKVPDYFNGSIRVMAVAVNENRIGTNSKSVKVKAPVILNASAPRLAAPGDIFEVGLRIANENEKLPQGNFTAQLNTSAGLEVVGTDKQEITVAQKTEKTIYFKVKALQEFGNNEIFFTVTPKNSKDIYKVSHTLSVRPASPYQVTVDMGNSLDKKFNIKDFKARALYPYRASKELDISQNPLVLFLSLETFLKHYPYGCTEQLTSQVFPRLAYGANKGKEGKQAIQSELDTMLSKLVARQGTDGSFSLWDDGFGDDELTMYVVDMLLTAEELDYKIQKPMLESAISRVRNYVSRTPYRNYQAKMMVYGHYLLARNGESQGAYLSSLENYLENNIPGYKNNIEGAYLAATYKMLQDKSKANSLISSYKSDKEKWEYYNDYDTALTRNAKYLYLVARYFPEKLNNSKEKDILKTMIEDIVSNRYNTMSANYSMLAISEYAKNFKADEAVFAVSCQDKPLDVKAGAVSKVDNFPAECSQFNVSTEQKAPLGNFWYVEQIGYNSKPAVKFSNGLEIYKELQNENGEVVKEVKAGDDLTVVIKVKSLTGKTLTNIAINDMFASPFMFVKDSLEGYYTFAEPKEDRIVIFGDFGTKTTTLTYKVKVANAGEFVVPAVAAQAMYNNAINASGDEGKLIVKKR